MASFNECIGFILAEEGGYVNHPRDPGGETNYGITKRSYPKIDIKNLTVDQVKDIYRRDYWQPIHGDDMPTAIAIVAMDMAVNMGPRTAIQIMQKALGLQGDGVIGPKTLTALRNKAPLAQFDVITNMSAERALLYSRMSGWGIFGNGWLRRSLRIHATAWNNAT